MASPYLAEHWIKPSSIPVKTVQHAVMVMGVVTALQWPLSFYEGAIPIVGALRGMCRTLAASPDVRVFVECNPRALRRARSSALELLAELRRVGLEPRVIDERAGAVVMLNASPAGAKPHDLLALSELAVFSRLVRSDMINTLREDYILTARSKGMSDKYILLRHALRPSSLSLMTVVGITGTPPRVRRFGG